MCKLQQNEHKKFELKNFIRFFEGKSGVFEIENGVFS